MFKNMSTINQIFTVDSVLISRWTFIQHVLTHPILLFYYDVLCIFMSSSWHRVKPAWWSLGNNTIQYTIPTFAMARRLITWDCPCHAMFQYVPLPNHPNSAERSRYSGRQANGDATGYVARDRPAHVGWSARWALHGSRLHGTRCSSHVAGAEAKGGWRGAKNSMTKTIPNEIVSAFVNFVNYWLVEHGLLDEQAFIKCSRNDKISEFDACRAGLTNAGWRRT